MAERLNGLKRSLLCGKVTEANLDENNGNGMGTKKKEILEPLYLLI